MVDLWLPPFILLIGAGLILAVAAVPPWRAAGLNRYWRVGVITLALVAVLLTGGAVESSHQLTLWSSLTALTAPLAIQSSKAGQWLGASLLVTALAAALMTRHPGDREETDLHEGSIYPGIGARDGALLLIVLAVSLVSMLPSNLLTLVLAWSVLDTVAAVASLIAFRPGNDNEWRYLLLNWSSGLIATFFLWGAALPSQADVAFQDLTSAPLSGWTGVALTLAILFRLSPYPLHLLRRRAWPSRGRSRPDLVSALQTGSVAAGIWLMIQMTGSEMLPDLGRQIISALLLTGLVACGLLAWLSDQDRQAVGWIMTSQAGLTALAGLWAGPNAALAEGLVLILVAGLLTLWTDSKHRSVESMVAVGIGIAALAGLPLTWGAKGRFALYQSWLDGGWGLYLFLATGALLLVLATVGRLLVRPTTPPSSRNERLILGAALALPAVSVLIQSGPLFPQGNVLVWLAVLAPVGGAALLTWGAETLQPLQVQIAARLRAQLTLGGLRRQVLLWGRLVGRATQAIYQVLEGEGALLWVLILLVLGWVLLTSSSPG